VRALIPIISCCFLTCCATSSPEGGTIQVDYRRLADCAYSRLSPIVGPGLMKADIPTQGISKLTLEPNGIRYWELVISAAGPNQARAEFNPGRNIWGSDAGGSAKAVWPVVQACSQ
jgi:hypothetical protein